MCEVCAVFGVSPHWADAADPLTTHNIAAGILENRTERAKRLYLINRILRPVGLTANDWDGEAFSIEDAQGRRALAADLSALWQVAETLGHIQIDPLDKGFMPAVTLWSDSSHA